MSLENPLFVLGIYFGIALFIGFLGMMYVHAMEKQGKETEVEPDMVLFTSGSWFITIPILFILSIIYLINLLAKKLSVILIGEEDKQ